MFENKFAFAIAIYLRVQKFLPYPRSRKFVRLRLACNLFGLQFSYPNKSVQLTTLKPRLSSGAFSPTSKIFVNAMFFEASIILKFRSFSLSKISGFKMNLHLVSLFLLGCCCLQATAMPKMMSSVQGSNSSVDRYAVITQFMASGTRNVRWETMPNNRMDESGKAVKDTLHGSKGSFGCLDIQGREQAHGKEYTRPNGKFKYSCNDGLEEVIGRWNLPWIHTIHCRNLNPHLRNFSLSRFRPRKQTMD